jgi:hypothetical protein
VLLGEFSDAQRIQYIVVLLGFFESQYIVC